VRLTGRKKREDIVSSGPTMVFSSSILSDVDAAWSQSLRGGSSKPWAPQITVPSGPNFRTPNRSRSASRSCTPRSTSVRSRASEVCESPRGRSMPWERSLRGTAPAPGLNGRAASVDHTPSRSKRRSLSHWWAEKSAPPKVSHRSASRTPQGSPMTPDADDAISDTSVVDSHARVTAAVMLLNRMPQREKRLSVEQKRHRLAELSRDQLSTEKSALSENSCRSMLVGDLGSQSSGNRNWLRSLRQGSSCPPSAQSSLTRAHEPSMHTSDRAASHSRRRAASHSSERFVMAGPEQLQARQRQALDKYLERARSVSVGHSAPATPERHTSSSCRRRIRTPGQISLEQGFERNCGGHTAQRALSARGRSAQRSISGTPERSISSGCCPFNARERAALQTHLERAAAKSCSAPQSGSATPERMRPLPVHERAPARHLTYKKIEDHLGKHLQKHLQRVAAAQAASEAEAEKKSVSAQSLRTCSKTQSTGRTRQAASTTASKVLGENNVDKDWVREATKPEDRAERARAATQTKLEQALVHQRNKVCVFKRRAVAAPQ